MFSLCDLRFVFCSRDLDVLHAQRIIGFYLNYPQINEVEKSDHVLMHLHRTILKLRYVAITTIVRQRSIAQKHLN